MESRRQGNPGGLLCHLAGIMVMLLVSRLSLANHSDSGSFLAVPALFSQDGCQREGFWVILTHGNSYHMDIWTGVSFLAFRWWLVSPVFLTRISLS